MLSDACVRRNELLEKSLSLMRQQANQKQEELRWKYFTSKQLEGTEEAKEYLQLTARKLLADIKAGSSQPIKDPLKAEEAENLKAEDALESKE